MSWQSVSNKDEAQTPNIASARPKLQLKPRMSIGHLPASNKLDARVSSLIGGGQQISDNNSIFGITQATESTQADSMFSGSAVLLNSTGMGSAVEFGAIGADFRTSITKNIQRRGTVPTRPSREEARESELSSVDNRESGCTDEGQVNKIESVIPAKCYSAVEIEEFKDSDNGRLSKLSPSSGGRLR